MIHYDTTDETDDSCCLHYSLQSGSHINLEMHRIPPLAAKLFDGGYATIVRECEVLLASNSTNGLRPFTNIIFLSLTVVH